MAQQIAEILLHRGVKFRDIKAMRTQEAGGTATKPQTSKKPSEVLRCPHEQRNNCFWITYRL